MYSEAFSALECLYAELDRAQAALNAACDGCGECCCFDRVDHILYASDLERAHLLSGPPPPPPSEPELAARGLRCPYQANGKCIARDARVLGCRLHFCRWPADAPEAEEDFCERWHAKLKHLHQTLGLAWRYGPLLPLSNGEKQ